VDLRQKKQQKAAEDRGGVYTGLYCGDEVQGDVRGGKSEWKRQGKA